MLEGRRDRDAALARYAAFSDAHRWKFECMLEVQHAVPRLRPRLRIYEVGVAYYGRSYEEGKKITWKDGVKAILAIIRFRFSN